MDYTDKPCNDDIDILSDIGFIDPMNNRRRRKPKKKIPPQELSLTIKEIGSGGDGVGVHEGVRVFVPKTTAGDVVRIRVEGGVRDGCHGQVLEFIEQSPSRISAPCPHYETCGGCSLQHLSERDYRDWKIDHVKKTLARARVEPEQWDEAIFLSAGTRRRCTLSVKKIGKKILIGYLSARSHYITDVSHCPILTPKLEELLTTLRPYLFDLLPEGKAVRLALQDAGAVEALMIGEGWRADKDDFTLAQKECLAEMAAALNLARISYCSDEASEPEVMISRAPLRKTFGNITVTLPAGAFLQASNAGEKALVESVMKYAKGAQSAIDLFCGCGTFTGALLSEGASVHAVDSFAAGTKALALCQNPKLSTEVVNLFQEPIITRDLNAYDVAVFDPPRAGAKAQAEELAQSDVARIIAVSCNPSTFARDARILIEDGDYILKSIRIIDQFVWSSHIEVVALFER